MTNTADAEPIPEDTTEEEKAEKEKAEKEAATRRAQLAMWEIHDTTLMDHW